MYQCNVRVVFFLILLMMGHQGFTQSRQPHFFNDIKSAEFFSSSNVEREYYVVLGTFYLKKNALEFCKSFKPSISQPHILSTQGVYKVVIGPLHTRLDLMQVKKSLNGKTPVANTYEHQFIDEYAKPKTPIQSATKPSGWSFTGSLGYSHYANMYENDGQTVLGRLAIGHTLFEVSPSVVGLEVGVQNGNTMRLAVPQETLDELGGLPIQSTVKPMLDLLATVQSHFRSMNPFFTELKAGVAFRNWDITDRDSVNNPSRVAGELQAGIGYCIRPFASVDLLYQGVYGSNPTFKADAVQQTGHLNNVSVQNGLLLGFSLHI